jgi:regulator of protease activity HflC (stomatin/prohibitin superfamily)
VFLIPFVDRPVVVDLRELCVEIPHQGCITKDNVPIQIDFLVYRQVIDAMTSVVAVTNFASASQGIAATTLRAVIGDIVWTTCWLAGTKLIRTWGGKPHAGVDRRMLTPCLTFSGSC